MVPSIVTVTADWNREYIAGAGPVDVDPVVELVVVDVAVGVAGDEHAITRTTAAENKARWVRISNS